MEKTRGDCRESEGERLAVDEGRYKCVSEYDPVLRSHCRLEPQEVSGRKRSSASQYRANITSTDATDSWRPWQR
jgi:hypothetical protein